MEKSDSLIYQRSTLEFLTVALEYCSFVENAERMNLSDFVDKIVKLLPLLYLKASVLSSADSEEDIDLEQVITEDMYELVRQSVANLLGEKDSYLETFHPDMPYSDMPIAAFISEDIADVYQDVGSFVALFRQENEIVMKESLLVCYSNFKTYWGQRLLNGLKALHAIRYDAEVEWAREEVFE